MRENEQKIREMFERIQIYSEFSPEPIKITEYKWNKSMTDFEVIYFLGNVKYVFRYNDQIASEIVGDFLKNPLEQLENEVLYIKRMKERGIGAKEYFRLRKLNCLPGNQIASFLRQLEPVEPSLRFKIGGMCNG